MRSLQVSVTYTLPLSVMMEMGKLYQERVRRLTAPAGVTIATVELLCASSTVKTFPKLSAAIAIKFPPKPVARVLEERHRDGVGYPQVASVRTVPEVVSAIKIVVLEYAVE